jgi:hypothetical protein
MADKNLTVFQRLGRVLGGESSSPTYVIDPKSFANLNPQETEQKKLEAQQTFFLQNQWKKIDNELYQKAVYYEPTRIASYYDYEAMEYSIIGATKIATPDGFITIKELADKGRDYEFITYAYDHNLKKVVPAMARNAHYTRDEMTYKITFDDNSFIIATYGHRFLKRDGVFEILENLKPGDSMMPFYRKSFYNNEKYNWVYTCNNEEGHNGWVAEHTLVAEWFYNQKLKENEEVHHIDFNGKNNNPENLKIWDISEHRAYHARLNNEKLWSNPDYRAKMLEISKRTDNKHNWNGERSGENNPAYIKIDFNTIINVAKEKRTIELTAKHLGVSYRKIQNELRFNGFKNWDNFLSIYKIKKYRPISENFESINFKLIPWDLLVDTAKEEKLMLKVCVKLNITLGKLRSTLRQGGYNNWKTFTDAYGITMGKTGRKKQGVMTVNHKIVSIEPHGIMPVYDLTVPGYKNFATDTIFSHNTPEIAVALDIFSDEATTASESGKILTIFSESTRIKNELTDLFENVLDINTNLNSWARNLCKYGDNFVYLKIVPKKGVIGCTQLPNVEVTRSEPGFNFVTSQDALQKERVSKFFWKDKNIEFNSFEVAHFRLLGDDRKLPYGTSILEKVRRIWKQLLLSEDAMLVYRVTRAPERRVYKIFVGNMDDKDIDPYVDKIANNFKRVNMVNSNNGQTDTRYNPLAVDQDYFIPVRDPALTMPIETLPGAQNLSEIADIEYIQKKMLAALRVPKAFLGFDEATGEGKNLAILDIRFARAVHRIQKALIQELNKIAIIHLYTKGYEDDLNNFTLQLTTPSTQADILKVQNWKEKITLYKDAVSDAGNGFAAVSMTWAKKEILGMSEEDIKLDIQRQAVEKAGGEELKMIGETIKQTGLFREIYKAYKINPDNMSTPGGVTGGEQPQPGGGGGSSSVGMDFTTPLEPGAPGAEAGGIPGAEPGVPGAEGAETPEAELGGTTPEEKNDLSEIARRNLDKRRISLNESITKTIKDIDDLLKD